MKKSSSYIFINILKPIFFILIAKSKQTANVSPAIASAKTEEQVTQFHRAWQNWADGTTLHGIKYVFDGESFFVRRYVVFYIIFPKIFSI